MIYAFELAQHVGYHPSAFYMVLSGKKRPSSQKAKLLEKFSGISRLAWLYPEEFFNPRAPHLYTGPWPPLLDHLEGEARVWAEKIIRAFPDGPPTKEQFRQWKRARRKTQKAKKGGNSE